MVRTLLILALTLAAVGCEKTIHEARNAQPRPALASANS